MFPPEGLLLIVANPPLFCRIAAYLILGSLLHNCLRLLATAESCTDWCHQSSHRTDTFKHRYYAPSLGRFLQPDPIDDQDEVHLYNYVENAPLDFIDPYGLAPANAPDGKGGFLTPEQRELLDAYNDAYFGSRGKGGKKPRKKVKKIEKPKDEEKVPCKGGNNLKKRSDKDKPQPTNDFDPTTELGMLAAEINARRLAEGEEILGEDDRSELRSFWHRYGKKKCRIWAMGKF